MAELHYVIIGNGTAGNRAAEVLRQGDGDAKITLISAEPTHYVFRHKLANYLTDNRNIENLSVHPPEWYSERKIRLRLNQPVMHVRPREKKIALAHREIVAYDKLLICSGARHRMPEYLSHFSQHLTRFSTGVDALVFKKRLDGIKHITLLGGDCIGLSLAAALLPVGKKITLVMDDYRFWPLEFDDAIKDRLAASLDKKGIEVISGDVVSEIQRQNGGLVVNTRGGKAIKTDAAAVTCGMLPNLDFLEASGIDMQEGVLVNERLESAIENIWAAGECAQIYYPEIKDYRCSTGYRNAETQGELAARNMLGGSGAASLLPPGKVIIAGEEFVTYGWRGFSLDEKN